MKLGKVEEVLYAREMAHTAGITEDAARSLVLRAMEQVPADIENDVARFSNVRAAIWRWIGRTGTADAHVWLEPARDAAMVARQGSEYLDRAIKAEDDAARVHTSATGVGRFLRWILRG